VSWWQNLFLGPYAAFPVPPAFGDRLPQNEEGEFLGERSFECHLHEGLAYYMPLGRLANPPRSEPREMFFGGNPGWPWEPDLVDVDQRAEVAWFTQEYAADLAELEAVFGAKPTFGWGLLSWHS
jgi:hypothetical protein